MTKRKERHKEEIENQKRKRETREEELTKIQDEMKNRKEQK